MTVVDNFLYGFKKFLSIHYMWQRLNINMHRDHTTEAISTLPRKLKRRPPPTLLCCCRLQVPIGCQMYCLRRSPCLYLYRYTCMAPAVFVMLPASSLPTAHGCVRVRLWPSVTGLPLPMVGLFFAVSQVRPQGQRVYNDQAAANQQRLASSAQI
jgi:hypothetical protein